MCNLATHPCQDGSGQASVIFISTWGVVHGRDASCKGSHRKARLPGLKPSSATAQLMDLGLVSSPPYTWVSSLSTHWISQMKSDMYVIGL